MLPVCYLKMVAEVSTSLGQSKRVSVIVPTFNRAESLGWVLAGLAAQTVPAVDFEVVVVCDGSTDATLAMLDLLDPPFELRVFQQENSGPSTARNRAVAEATGELLVFIDDDLVPGPNCLAGHLALYEATSRPSVGIGPMLRPPNFELQPWTRWEQKMLDKQYDAFTPGEAPASPRQFYTANASLSRSEFIAVGGFDPGMRRGEDVDLGYRLAEQGLGFFFLPDAVGHHYARRAYASWLTSATAYGAADVDFHTSRDQSWLLGEIANEWRRRHVFVRVSSRIGVGRPRVAQAIEAVLAPLTRRQSIIGSERPVDAALSGVFNLRYYCAMADALGGRDAFLDLMGAHELSGRPLDG